MKKNKVLLNIVSVFCFIYGALYTFSLVFIPVGIYCFIAGKKFSYKADHLLDNYSVDKKVMKAYTIFASIACFPFGLLSIIAYFSVYGNNITIENTETKPEADFKNVETDETETKKAEEDLTEAKAESKEKMSGNEGFDEVAEKINKLEKLKNFRDKNIITEEEFEMAKNQLFGDNDKK